MPAILKKVPVFLLLSGLLALVPARSQADDLFKTGGGLFQKPLFEGDGLFLRDGAAGSSEKAPAQKNDSEALGKLIKEQEIKQARLQKQMVYTEMVMTADNELLRQMKKVADWMNDYVVWNHHFPEQSVGGEDPYNLTFGQSDELNIAMRQMNLLVPNNPYMHGGIYMEPGKDVDPNLQIADDQPMPIIPSDSKYNRNRIKIFYDRSLNASDMAQLATNPPYDWQATPGTIGIVTDSAYYFVVWGAGIDGKPIRDPVSGNVRLVVGNYQTWDQPPLQP